MKTLLLILSLSLATFALDVTAPKITAHENDKFTVPFTVDGAVGIVAFQFNINYDPDVLTPIGCTTAGIASSLTATCHSDEPGVYRIAVWGADNFTGAGDVLKVDFETHTGTSYLDLIDAQFYSMNGRVKTYVTDGEIVLE